MKARYWSLAIILVLINYLIFASLFNQLLETDFSLNYATRTPKPTFTPAPAQPVIIVPTLTPVPPMPTPTATRVLQDSNLETGGDTLPAGENSQAEALSAAQPAGQPQLVAPGPVNIRSGPGINYSVIGTLNANTTATIVGRNTEASWWQIRISGEASGWVSDAVVSASNTDGVPVAEAPPAPVAAAPAPQPASNPPPAPQKPKHQYEPTGWYDDTNYGLTRFLGDIKDVNGNPVNGVFVQASCGNYSTISYPSGPVGWGGYHESADWPAGFYDITIDSKPVPCIWTLTIVDTDDRKTVKARLSEAVPVEVTQEKSIITANWRKNW
jgi:hypothetical protein